LCLLCEMLHALHCHKTVAMKTPMSVSDTGQRLHWELGQFYMCPAESDSQPFSMGSGTEMKHANLRCISVRVGTGCIGTGSILVPVLGTQPLSCCCGSVQCASGVDMWTCGHVEWR